MIKIFIRIRDKETSKISNAISLQDIVYKQNEIAFEFKEYGSEEYETLSYKDFLFYKDNYDLLIQIKD
jgi:hypothetical protein